MDYEKKYNEAVKELGNFLALLKRNGVANDDGIIETNLVRIFPELAESEDERIRKAIIHYILYETKGTISEATEHVWVTWLEKQKQTKQQ